MRGDGKGRLFQQKGGRIWWVAYYGPTPDGRWGQIRESSGETDETKAEGFLKKRLRAVKNDLDGIRKFEGPGARRVTVSELLDALESDQRAKKRKSIDQTLYHLRPVREFFGHLRAEAVRPETIRRFIDERRAAGRADATINRATELLGRAFRLAVEDERLVYCPRIPSLAEDNARQGFFEVAEVERLLPLLAPPLDDITRFGYLTGWRRGMILGLTWEEVDRRDGSIRLPGGRTKNGKPQSIALDAELSAIVERRAAARSFPTAGGGAALSAFVFHRDGQPINKVVFGKHFRAACVRAGLGRRDENGHYSGKLFHDLRRTAARDMIRAGVPQAVAKTITGHKTDSMFSRYNITDSKDQLDALAALSRSRSAAASRVSNVAGFPGR